MARFSNRKKQKALPITQPRYVFEGLEPRLLLSADPFTAAVADSASLNPFANADPSEDEALAAFAALTRTDADTLLPAPETPVPLDLDSLAQLYASEDLDAVSPATEDGDEVRRELVIVDAATPDYQQLLNYLTESDDSRSFEIVILQGGEDGIEQISAALSRCTDLDAVHIISHGTDAAVQLGDTRLDSASLAAYADAISDWGDALTAEADLLFYGCDLAATADGRLLVEAIAGLTGADVAASDDLTGHASQGGDWDLEIQVGAIENATPFTAGLQQGWNGLLATITVDTTSDVKDGTTTSIAALLGDKGADGKISLREAIEATNLDPNVSTPDEIHFQITDALIGGAHTIDVSAGGLPTISEAVIINGTTDLDYSGTPIIELDGMSAGTTGLSITGDGVTIHGLVINRFSGHGIEITGDNNRIESSYIGTDVTGAIDKGNSQLGIRINNASGNHIGGSGVGNVVSGNSFAGIAIVGSTSSNNFIQGNLIGTNAAGAAPIGNNHYGIDIWSGGPANTTIGGTTTDLRNVISGNGWAGIHISGGSATGNLVQGNYIGTDISGTLGIANGSSGIPGGIDIDGGADNNTIGGTADGAGNLIAFNTGPGVDVDDPTTVRNAILENEIHSNTDIGIKHNSGGNQARNDPVLSSVLTNGVGSVAITGTYSDASLGADTPVIIDFFSNPGNDREGRTYLGSDTLTTNGFGDSVINSSISATVAAGDYVTATVTDSSGNTSEFSVGEPAAAASLIAGDDSATTNEDTAVVIDVSANDSAATTLLDHTLATNGTLVDNGDGTFTYTPDADFNGADNFDYVITDGSDATSHYWRLDGDAVDQVGGNDGTLFGAPTTVAGQYGEALHFDDTTESDYVSIPDFAYASDSTVSFRFKVDDNSGTLFQYFYSHGNAGTTNSLNVYLGEGGNGFYPDTIVTNLRDSNDAVDEAALNVDIGSGGLNLIGDGQWHSYTLTFENGVGSKVYIDGVLQNGSGRGADALDPAAPLILGAPSTFSSGRYYGGDLDSLQIIDQALNAPDVAALHAGTASAQDSATVSITVDPVNDAPVLAAIGDKSIDEGAIVGFTASATDVDLPADTLSFSLDAASLALGMTIDANTGAFSWTPTESQGGLTPSVTVTVTDDGTGNMIDSETFQITVNDLNTAPVLGAIGDQSVDELATLTFTATATDADLPADTLTFSLDAASLALGMSLDANSGAFAWTPSEAQGGLTPSVTITVTDDGTGNLIDSETFTITVNDLNTAPVLGAIGSQSVDELATLTFTATATDADLPADTLSFSLDAASLALGMSLDANSGAFAWTPSEAQGGLTPSVTITVTDDGTGNLIDSETFTITVNDLNTAPVLGAIGDQSVDELATLTFTATATDADLPADTLSFSLDAASLALGMTIDANTGAFSWTPTESQGGLTPSVTVTVTDAGTGNLIDSETFQITVNDTNTAPVLGAIGDQSVDELATLTFTATATDADLPADTLAFSLDAASLALGMTIDANTGAFSWTPTESQGGLTPSVTVTVTDDGTGNLVDSETFTITVNDVNTAPVIVTNAGLSVPEEATRTITSAELETTDADNTATEIEYTLTSLPSGGSVRLNGSSLGLNDTFTQDDINNGRVSYRDADEGSSTSFQFTVSDGTSTTGNITFSVNGQPINDAPVVTAPGSNLNATEQVNLAIEGLGFSVADIDEAGGGATATLSVGEGTLTVLIGDSGVIISSGNGTGNVTLTGTIAQLDNLLTGSGTGTITYLNNLDAPSASTVMTVTVNDQGNTGTDPGLTGDAGSEEGVNSQTINITAINDAPVLGAIGDQSVDELATLTFTATATDADLPADTLSFSLDAASLALGMTIDANTGAFSWTPTESQGGLTPSVTMTVTDNGTGNLIDGETFTITVNDTNTAPVLGAIGDQSVDELATLTFTATATDADLPADTLSFSLDAASLALGMTIDANTGAFSWTPSEAQGGLTPSVTVTVTDDGIGNQIDSETFTITVNDLNTAPVLGAIGSQSVDELATLTFTATATDADLPADTLSFSLDAASLALGMTIDANTGAFSWTPTESQGGLTPLVTVTVTDNGTGNLIDSETFTITVNDTNTAPVLGAIGNQSVDELATLTFTATATDADLPADTLSFSLDAASLALGMTIDANTGAFSWTPTESQGGLTPSVTVTVTDDGTGDLIDSETFTITVNDLNTAPVLGAIGSQSVDELATLTFTATATDADLPADTLSFSLDAASLALGMSLDANTGAFSWTPTEAQGGLTPSVTITVTDDGTGNLIDSETFTITVNDLNTAPVLGAIGSQSVDELATLTFTATATDADLPADTLSFSLDAASLALGMTIDANTGAFSWTPTESQGGLTPSVTVTVTDDGTGNLIDSETFTITVNDLNTAPVLSVIGNQSVDELATLTFTATATDADLPTDTLTFSLDAASLALGMTIDANTGAFSWTPTESQGGLTPSVTVTVTDNGTGNLIDNETFTITVNDTNTAPVLGAIGNQSVDELATLTFTATATDADLPTDTLTFSLDAASLALGMTIDANTGAFSWTPTESQGGLTPSVTVTVTDNGTGNLIHNETFTITVNDLNTAPALGAIGDQSVDELATVTFTATATDADLPADTLTFSLDAASLALGMTIDANTGAFSWTPTESQGGLTPSVTVTVTDNGTGNLIDNETFTITVNSTNIAPVITSDGSGATAFLNAAENQTAVTTVTSGDADLPIDTLTHTKSGGADQALFNLDPGTGVLTFASAPDFESFADANLDGVYEVEVQVSDGIDTDTQLISVTVTDGNEMPTAVALGNLTVAGNSDGAIISNLTTTDPDSGDSHTYSVDDARFEVVAGQLKLKAGQTLEFASEPSISLNVTSTDTGGLSVSQGFTLTVANTANTNTASNVATTPPVVPQFDPPAAEITSESLSMSNDTPVYSAAPLESDAADITDAPDEATENESETPSSNEGTDVEPDVLLASLDGGDGAGVFADDIQVQADNAEKLDAAERKVLVRQLIEIFSREGDVDKDFSALFEEAGFLDGLNGLRDDVAEDAFGERTMIGSSVAAATGLSVGYVVWLLRSGMLLSSVLSSMPAWRLVDPLPVLAYLSDNDDDDKDDDTLASLIAEHSEQAGPAQDRQDKE